MTTAADRLAQRIRLELQARGIATAVELAVALRVSQPTFSRAIAGMGDEIVRLGETRATRYALALGRGESLYRVTVSGQAEELGALQALSGGHFLLG
ncbi:MAG: hypothetical protein LBK60_04260 [Verrucomicrobiales bacterium]|jgi:hypothetical protein|nr:hypothetical protein [Verrucomicrobiales bacterium]